MSVNSLPPFKAAVVPGSGRGQEHNVPTINLDLSQIPGEIAEGIYAGWLNVEDLDHALFGQAMEAAIHYGPRPVFGDSLAFEAHLLDVTADPPPSQVTIKLIERLRDVQDFGSAEELYAQITDDIAQCRVILERDAQST